MDEVIGLASVSTNLLVLLVGIRLVRHVTRIEIKVEMMWDEFVKARGKK
jgi:hypothetical protein